jgi:hypothetical protein
MTSRIHTQLIAAIVAAFAIVALTASGATAARSEPSNVLHYTEPGSTGYVPKATVNIPAWLANFREPGSTGYVPKATHVTIPANLVNFREPGSTGFVPAASPSTVSASGGLDWASALIGGGVVLGAGLVCAGAALALRRRRALAHA